MTFDINQVQIPHEYQNRFKRCIARRSRLNQLWEGFLANPILNPSLDLYTPLQQLRKDDFSDQLSREAAMAVANGDDAQSGLAFFSNPLRFPTFGPGFSKDDDRYQPSWEPPSARPGHGYWWAFTLEHDPGGPLGLTEQLDWLWGRDRLLRWSHFVGQFGSEVKVYSGV